MKIYPDKLSAQLVKQLAPVYLVAGDEPLQVEESVAAIRKAAAAVGFVERERFVAERGFDWNEFRAAAANVSLFSNQKIIELKLPSGKPGDTGARVLKEYCEHIQPDVLLLVSGGKVDQRASWVKALDKTGVFVTVWPIDAKRLPQWISNRLRERGIHAELAVAQLIAERVEGNLLAAAQEIEKLVLLCGSGELDEEAVRQAVADSARFDVFSLVDAALAGQTKRVLRSLEGLRGEGMEPVLILWALAREIRDLAKRAASRPGERPSLAGVWEKRRAAIESALSRHDQKQWRRFLQYAARIDRMIKGVRLGDAWQELANLLVAIAIKPSSRRIAS